MPLDIKNMPNIIKKCKKCGHSEFYVHENIGHKATVDQKTGVLEIYSCYYNKIEKIVCTNCKFEYNSDNFKDIEFCN